MKTFNELASLKDRVALITGGAGYIGSTIAETFAELGCQVAILDRDQDSCFKKAQNIEEKYKVKTLSLSANLEEEVEAREAPHIVIKKFGRLDILVHCAAFAGTTPLEGWLTPFEEQSSATWRRALEVNLTAPFVMTQEATPALRKSGHGSVINIASIYGLVGPDFRLYEGTNMGNPAAYAVSKGGLLQLTRWLATTLAPDIRINTITPGGLWRNQPDTFYQRYIDRTPVRRMGTEEDFKGAAAYLASDLSNYVTGQNIIVDGGWTAW